MDRTIMQNLSEAPSVPGSESEIRPIWQTPELIEVDINEVTASTKAAPAGDGSITRHDS